MCLTCNGFRGIYDYLTIRYSITYRRITCRTIGRSTYELTLPNIAVYKMKLVISLPLEYNLGITLDLC